jgi:hypothetical protein
MNVKIIVNTNSKINQNISFYSIENCIILSSKEFTSIKQIGFNYDKSQIFQAFSGDLRNQSSFN